MDGRFKNKEFKTADELSQWVNTNQEFITKIVTITEVGFDYQTYHHFTIFYWGTI